MKLIFDLNEKPTKGDVIIFDGKSWSLVRKSQFLNELTSRINDLEHKFEEHISTSNSTFKSIDKKLESHHKALKQLTGGK